MSRTIDRARDRIGASGAASGLDPELARYVSDPVGFATQVLGVAPWTKQAELLRAVAEHDRVAVRSGHKTGKSLSVAILALWFVCTRADARVVLTAPSSHQVRRILWREVRRLHRGARLPLGGALYDTPELGLQFDDGREVTGFATDTPERMSGISGEAALFIVDEASGVTPELFDAIEGNRAGGAKLLLCGNPTRLSGEFFDAFNRKAAFYRPLAISSLDSPNVTGEARVPGLATRAWCDEKGEEWGTDGPLYAVRVRGEFPTQADNAVISFALVTEATARYRVLDPAEFQKQGALQLGVDVARFGSDDSVIAIRRGNAVLPLVVLHGQDTVQVAGKVAELARDHALPSERPVVAVDVVGVGGGVADVLKQQPGILVREVNVAESSPNDTDHRLRDALWFGLAKWLRGGGALPPDPRLEGELVAALYTFTPAGKRLVEGKDLMRARLKRSPDRADALALAVHADSNAAWMGNYVDAMTRFQAGGLRLPGTTWHKDKGRFE
jgi:hypothetical protein